MNIRSLSRFFIYISLIVLEFAGVTFDNLTFGIDQVIMDGITQNDRCVTPFLEIEGTGVLSIIITVLQA